MSGTALLLVGEGKRQGQTLFKASLWRPFLKDPKDDLVLECAVSAGARYIVTYNLSDFLKAESLGVQVVTPSKLLSILTEIFQ